MVVGHAQQTHDARGFVGGQRDKGPRVDVELAGAAQALKAIKQDPRGGKLDALQRLLDPALGQRSQKSSFGRG